MQEENSKNWFERLNERLDQTPRPSDEEIAQHKAAWNSLEGTSKESVFMKEDRLIALKVWSYKDGVIGDGWEVLSPEDGEHYQKVCLRHNLKNPGDANTITMRWIDGQWIEENQQGNSNVKTA